MHTHDIIFELNYHYLWLLKTLANKDFKKARKQLNIDQELLKIIKSLTYDDLNHLCLSEKTIFSLNVSSLRLDELSDDHPYLPERKLISSHFSKELK